MLKHIKKQGKKTEPNQCDPIYWTYDIGENNDCSVDDLICDNVKDLITFFGTQSTAKACFATKYVNRKLLTYDPKQRTRIRFSLMPQKVSTVVDVRCSKVSERIQAINDFVAAGYEVHVNFSPVIIYEGWQEDWKLLLQEIDDTLNQQSKDQLKAEIIFLTHNERLYDLNMKWHSRGEDYLWTPEKQQRKLSQNGMWNLRYRNNWKRNGIEDLSKLIKKTMPYCNVRYAF